MAADPPYLYDPPSSQRSNMNPTYDFDPKAVTRASWSQASVNSSPKRRPNGPLIDFNRHPDSYVIVPYGGDHDLPPLPAKTRKTIVVTRWLQFFLRLLQVIGALGLLVCVICIKGIDDLEGWILRIPPACDALMCCYAIYHLIRPANARTAMSSASYHVFALFTDIGLIPFMIVNAFFTQNQWSMDTSTDGRWHSFFNTTDTNLLLLVTWVTAISLGGLHLLSIGIDIYLIIIFRKIARYPPDSNPLEDNKFNRAARKHAYKNSEVTVSISEQKFARMSGSTLNIDRPTSQSLMAGKLIPDANVRPMSFYQSRQNIDQSYPARTQDSARMSQATLYQASPAASRTDLNSRGGRTHSRPGSAHSRSQSRSQSRPRSQGGASNRASYHGGQTVHDPMPSRPMSFINGSNAPSRYSSPLPGPQAHVPEDVAKTQQKDGLLTNDNWYSFPETIDGDLSSPRRTPQPPQQVETHSDEDDEGLRNPNYGQLECSRREEQDLLPQPSSTKPPTPPRHASVNHSASNDNGAFYFSDMPSGTLDLYGNSHDSSLPTQSYLDDAENVSYSNVSSHSANEKDRSDSNSAHNSEGTIGRALTVTSAVSSLYSQSDSPNMSRAASPKRKAYGDLASATAGVLGQHQSATSSRLSVPNPRSSRKKSRSRERREAEGRALQRGHVEKGGRVISRTGVDLADASVLYIGSDVSSAVSSQQNSLRGRQVSGKIAEEGRAGPKAGGGWFGGALRRREVSGTA